ncbi:unnamed protein product [Fraxinus pennsylvanica]|uniref:Uncharacterized protein n=1 Tax=Fraxinus pennsylvanica TaxID=56036 RepID=A0AAD1ZS70_9LAMI|nr:unnamed protein product [Fraxinus pennsylvanica]
MPKPCSFIISEPKNSSLVCYHHSMVQSCANLGNVVGSQAIKDSRFYYFIRYSPVSKSKATKTQASISRTSQPPPPPLLSSASTYALLHYEAALCRDFDQKVNAANKLASTRGFFSLTPPIRCPSACNICQLCSTAPPPQLH